MKRDLKQKELCKMLEFANVTCLTTFLVDTKPI